MIPTFARSMLKVFALLGCDFLSTFHGVSHSLGMEVFMKMFKRGPVRTPDDFFNWMLKIYQEKYSSFNRLFGLGGGGGGLSKNLVKPWA